MKKVIAFLAPVLSLPYFLPAQDVNMFNGSFSYGTSVMHVPSNKGPGVSLDVNYSAGIQMSQSASEIGLGWGINAGGAIYRNVVGYPDDTKNFVTRGVNYNAGDIIGQGALYPE